MDHEASTFDLQPSLKLFDILDALSLQVDHLLLVFELALHQTEVHFGNFGFCHLDVLNKVGLLFCKDVIVFFKEHMLVVESENFPIFLFRASVASDGLSSFLYVSQHFSSL